MKSNEKYPECEKLAKVSKESNAIGQFLDWLNDEQNTRLFKWSDEADNGEAKFIDETGDATVPSTYSFDEKEDEDFLNPEYETFPKGYYPVHKAHYQLLAQYFNIDLNKVEKERRQMLKELQNSS